MNKGNGKQSHWKVASTVFLLMLLPMSACQHTTTSSKPTKTPPQGEQVGGLTATPFVLIDSGAIPTSSSGPTSLWSNESLQMPEEYYGDVTKVATAVDGSGLLHAAWIVQTENGANSELRVFYEEMKTQNPATWSKPVQLYEETSDYCSLVALAIAMDSQDKAHVVWSRGEKIYYSGQPGEGGWPSPSLVGQNASAVCQAGIIQHGMLELVFDSRDQLVLVWPDTGKGIFFEADKPAGGEWSQPAEILTDIGWWWGSGYSLVFDGNKTLHLVWNGARVMHSYKPQNGAWTPAIIIPNSYSYLPPAMAIDSHNTIHMVWYDKQGEQVKIWYVQNSRGGWSKQMELALSNIVDIESWNMAIAGDDTLFLLWKQQSNLLPYRYITRMAGSNWSDTADIPLTNEDNDYSMTANRVFSMTSDQSGGIHITWFTGRGTTHLAHSVASIEKIALPPMSAPELAILSGVVEFPISTGPTERADIAMDGNTLIWNQKGAQDWDIFGYDRAAETEFPVIARAADQVNPAISGDIVVWEDHREQYNPRIYAYDLKNRAEFPVTASSSPQWQPAISGNTVIFKDWRKAGTCSWGGGLFGPSTSCDWDIWAADLGSHTEFPIDTNPNVQNLPRISGDWVIWAQWQNGDSFIYAKKLGAASQAIQVGSIDGNTRPAIDGNILVWKTWEGIYGYHLLTGRKFPVALGPGERSDPSISGNIVVWSDRRNGDADVYGYNLATGQEFAICLSAGDQSSPVIAGSDVAWVDERNGSTEIYAARLPFENNKQTGNIVPALTPTATPIPTATQAPVTPTMTPTPTFLPPGLHTQNIELVSQLDIPGIARDVEVVGNDAYIVTEDGELHIIDIGQPETPHKVGSLNYLEGATDLEIAGGFAYIVSYESGLHIINITQPANPYEESRFSTDGEADSLAVAGGYAYVEGDEMGLCVIRISDPGNPEELGCYKLNGMFGHVAISGNYAFVTQWNDPDADLHIFDISRPESLSKTDFSTNGGGDVAVVGNYVYIASDGLQIINVVDPTHPLETGSTRAEDSYSGLDVAGNYAYVASGPSGIRIINIMDPTAPFEAGFYITSNCLGVAVKNTHVYAINWDSNTVAGNSKLLILQLITKP